MSGYTNWRNKKHEFNDYIRSLNSDEPIFKFWEIISSTMKDVPAPEFTEIRYDGTFLLTWSSGIIFNIAVNLNHQIHWHSADGESYIDGDTTVYQINDLIPFFEKIIISSVMES